MTTSSAQRMFVAMDLNETARQAVAELQNDLSRRLPAVRWVPPEQLHITLHFLGATTDAQRQSIHDDAQVLCRRYAPVRVASRGLGVFPSSRRATVVWCGITQGGATITRLAADLEPIVERAGLAVDSRAFVPHITIGRVQRRRRVSRKAVETVLADHAGADIADWMATALTLYTSTLTHTGPVYTPAHRWPFAG